MIRNAYLITMALVCRVTARGVQRKKVRVRFANFVGEGAMLKFKFEGGQDPPEASIIHFGDTSEYILKETVEEVINYSVFANGTKADGKLVLQESTENVDFYTVFVYTRLDSATNRVAVAQISRKDKRNLGFSSKNINMPLAIWRFLDLRYSSNDTTSDVDVYTMTTGCENCAWEKKRKGNFMDGFYYNGTSIYFTKFRFVYGGKNGEILEREKQVKFSGRGI